MTVVRRQEESLDRRARSSFLSGVDVAVDDHEEYNEVARSMWRNKVERRREVNSFRHHG